MKENKYDDQRFFDQYAEMDRSKNGLESAGEWHELKKILPNFNNKSVLDLGCGYGWHSLYALENGASHVKALDISEKMLKIAKSKIAYSNIEYINHAIEDYDFEANSFDIVISSLAIHYVKDYAKLVADIYASLKPGGAFIMSVEHPIFTAEGSQDWVREDGEIKHFPVDNYFIEDQRNTNFLGSEIKKYHRTITSYVQTLIKNGFTVKELIEPKPDLKLMDIPGMQDELRRPMMLIIRADKLDLK